MSRVLVVGVVILIVLLATQSDLRAGRVPSFNSTSTVTRQTVQEKHRDGIKEKIILDLIAENKLLEAEKKRLQRLLEDAVRHLNECCRPVSWDSGPLAMGKNWHQKESKRNAIQHFDSSNGLTSRIFDGQGADDRQSYDQQSISDALSHFALHQSSDDEENDDGIHILHRAKALASRLQSRGEATAETSGSPTAAEQVPQKKRRKHRMHKRSIRAAKKQPM